VQERIELFKDGRLERSSVLFVSTYIKMLDEILDGGGS